MKLKAANIIAVELGILIGLVSWLGYSRFPSAEPRTAAEKVQESTADLAAPVAPDLEPREQRPSTTDYLTDQQQARLLAEQQALIRYQQEIAPRPYASSRLANGPIAADSSSYAEVDQEPAVVASEDLASPQTVAYVQPAQTLVYLQPAQIVVFSNPRRFATRCRRTPPSGARLAIASRRHDREGSHLSGSVASGPAKPPGVGGVGTRRHGNEPSCRPAQGFRRRGHR